MWIASGLDNIADPREVDLIVAAEKAKTIVIERPWYRKNPDVGLLEKPFDQTPFSEGLMEISSLAVAARENTGARRIKSIIGMTALATDLGAEAAALYGAYAEMYLTEGQLVLPVSRHIRADS